MGTRKKKKEYPWLNYLVSHNPSHRNRENAAKAVCASCPVINACRDHALAVQEPYGIWGGLSEDDRAAILTRRGIPLISHAS